MFGDNTPEDIAKTIAVLEKLVKGPKPTCIGALLAQICADRGETYYVMARRIGVPEGLLSRYRRGYSLPPKDFIASAKLEYAHTNELLAAIDLAAEKDRLVHDRALAELAKVRYIQQVLTGQPDQ